MKKQKLFFAIPTGILLLQATCVQASAIEIAQSYIDDAPLKITDFVENPWESMQLILGEIFRNRVFALSQTYFHLLSFLLLGAMISILLVKTEWISLLELLVAGGSFLLVSASLSMLVQDFSNSVNQWKTFLFGFIPAFSAVVAISGETVAASFYSGFFLLAVNALAQLLSAFLVPFMECYLALSLTSAFWIGNEFPEACKIIGKLLKKVVSIAGVAFSMVFGIQRVFASAADGVAVEASKAIGSAVPLVGSAITSAASAFFASMQVLKTGLGFAAFSVIGASFLPLYLTALAHLCLLWFCGFLSKLFSLPRCGQLFDCLAIGIEVLMAIVALYFFMVMFGTALMLVIGIGG